MAAHSRAHVEARTGQARTTAITATATSAAAQPVRQRVSQLTPSRRVQALAHSHLQPFAFTFTVSHTILSLSLSLDIVAAAHKAIATVATTTTTTKKLAPLFRTCFRRDGKHTHTTRSKGWLGNTHHHHSLTHLAPRLLE